MSLCIPAPSAAPLDLVLTYKLERSASFTWKTVECSQRHGAITTYEYELLGMDNWAKLERQIANITDTQVTVEGLTPYTKYVMRVKAYNSAGGSPNTENLELQTAKAGMYETCVHGQQSILQKPHCHHKILLFYKKALTSLQSAGFHHIHRMDHLKATKSDIRR
jgi:hypothetical protein